MQAFWFMVGPGLCPISKYGSSLSKAVDSSFLVVKNLILIIIFILQRVYRKYVGCQYSKPVLSSHSKKDKTKILITNGI